MKDEFDGEEFSDRVMGNEVLARRILRGFVDDMPNQLALLAHALEEGDATQARLTAHSIKGAAASVSGNEMREVSRKLEQQAREGDLEAASAALTELSETFGRAKAAMQSFCEDDAT
jgi:HPt (histidine-containing phosphotransfer) domain-containing protein